MFNGNRSRSSRVACLFGVWSQDYFVAVFGNKLGGDRP